MQAAGRRRRDWCIALGVSCAIHLLALGFVRFAPVPSTGVADDATPVAILRITKRAGYEHGRRGGSAAAPRVTRTKTQHGAPVVAAAHAATRGSSRASSSADAPASSGARVAARSPRTATAGNGSAGAPARDGTAPGDANAAAAGPDDSPGPAPTMTAEMLASLNQRMRDAIPSAPPKTMKLYAADLRTLAMRADASRWTVANYPLPEKGLFAHALIVRVGREAVAVRAIQRIGNAYICIGYLAKINEHDPQATLAGPYIGPCKKAWREQLGLVPKPSPEPPASADPSPNPTTTPPSPGASAVL